MTTTADEIEAIKSLKARYFRLMDQKDWAAIREVFTDDYVLDATGTGATDILTGADAMVELLEQSLQDTVTAHHGHMPEIEVLSDTEATGIWALADVIVFPDGSRVQGYGHYHDTYRKEDGVWKIATSTVTRLLFE